MGSDNLVRLTLPQSAQEVDDDGKLAMSEPFGTRSEPEGESNE
jgi:hypothetical protein